MRTGSRNVKLLLFALFAALALSACAGTRLTPVGAAANDVQGTYTLYLYGCHYPGDVKNLVFLVPEASTSRLEIFDINTSYRTKTAVPAQEALKLADSFLGCSSHRVWKTDIRRIPDPVGGTVGYEVRPLYVPIEFGFPDILLVNYVLHDATVTAYIRLDPQVESDLEASGGDKDSRDR